MNKKQIFQICEQVRTTQIDSTWTLRKEMTLDKETQVKTYFKQINKCFV